jgi:hypothetical protein
MIAKTTLGEFKRGAQYPFWPLIMVFRYNSRRVDMLHRKWIENKVFRPALGKCKVFLKGTSDNFDVRIKNKKRCSSLRYLNRHVRIMTLQSPGGYNEIDAEIENREIENLKLGAVTRVIPTTGTGNTP